MNLGQAQTNRLNQQYNNLLGATAIGSNAASNVGSQGVTSAANTGNFLTQQGNAQAAGAVGIGNALSGGLSNAANQYMQYNALQNAFNPSGAAGANSLANNPATTTSSPYQDAFGTSADPFAQASYLSGSSAY
jgi:hypothetical protein